MGFNNIVTLSAGLIGAAHGFSSSASMGQQASFGLPFSNGQGMGQMESMGAFAPKGCGAGGVNLKTAGDFAILSKSGITNVPGSEITGDMGVSPIAATAITGFALVLDGSGEFSKSEQVDGEVYAADYAPSTPQKLTTAVNDMEEAYTDAQSRPNPDPSRNELKGGLIGGETLTPGVYTWTTDVNIATDVMLAGGPCDVFILQTSSKVILGSGASVVLQGGVKASNVYWSSGGLMDMGTDSNMEGILLSKTGITLKTRAELNGRILAQTNAVLQKVKVTEPRDFTEPESTFVFVSQDGKFMRSPDPFDSPNVYVTAGSN